MNQEKPLLELSAVTKFFGKHQVLKDISFSINKGEVFSIVGANGSGKSTLLNIIFGNPVIKTTGGFSGSIRFDDKNINDISTHNAYDIGIGMVHQEFALFNGMTVVENIKLCKEETKVLFKSFAHSEIAYIDKNANSDSAVETLKLLGVEIDPLLKVDSLSIALKQFIELARELNKSDLKLLILDEPTAVLNEVDSDILLKLVRKIADRGVSVIFVSHRLDEVLTVSDKLMVLRDGVIISLNDKSHYTMNDIATEMIGTEIIKCEKIVKKTSEDVIMSFGNYEVDYPGELLKDFSLEIYKNEIVGITSLSGQGKLALGKGLMDFYPSRGMVRYKGNDFLALTYEQRLKSGVCVLCEDRKEIGLLLNHSVKDNIAFTANQVFDKYKKYSILKSLSPICSKTLEKDIKHYQELLNIGFKSMDQTLKELSGGNQQKTALARCLATQPEVMFISEPTRGIDIAAKEMLLRYLKKINKELGMTLVIASSELEELRRLCDRIVVLAEGKCSAILTPNDKAETYGLALSGLGGINEKK